MRRTTGQFQATVYGEETVRAFVPFPLPPTNPPLVLEGVLATLHAPQHVAVGGQLLSDGAPDAPSFHFLVLEGRPLEARYDGYTVCPLITGYGSVVMAEFDYRQQPISSFLVKPTAKNLPNGRT